MAEFKFMEPNPDEIIGNWFLNHKSVLSALKIKVKVDKTADWQVLKEFEFGTLAWDYEEGLRWQTTPDKVADLVAFIRKFHKEYNAPYVARSRMGIFRVFSLHFCDSNSWARSKEVFGAAGMKKSKQYDWIYEL